MNLLIRQSKLFNIPIEIIEKTNKLYLPMDKIEMMRKSYRKYVDKKNKWKDIIWEIFQVSKSHMISSNRRKCLYVPIKEKDILSLNNWYNNIESFVNKYFFGKEKIIYCNPKLGNGYIFGDADIIVDTTLIDFKNSTFITCKGSVQR